MIRHALAFGLAALLSAPAFAMPALKADVSVTGDVVTLGDLFEEAGVLAETPVFLSPRPGTAGIVPLDDVRAAAQKAGLTEFAAEGIADVRVARAGALIDDTALAALIADDLKLRGILGAGMVAETLFDRPVISLTAEAVASPARLTSLRYLPGNGAFTARFEIAGHAAPLELSGKIDLMIETAHLAGTRPAGTILSADDIVMLLVPLRHAESVGFALPEQLIGKQLQRQGREGLMLRPGDVAEPTLISRNDRVTLYFRSGPMTLTVRGQALNAATEGGPVQVLNLMSNRIVHGTAVGPGAVEITAAPLTVAGL